MNVTRKRLRCCLGLHWWSPWYDLTLDQRIIAPFVDRRRVCRWCGRKDVQYGSPQGRTA